MRHENLIYCCIDYYTILADKKPPDYSGDAAWLLYKEHFGNLLLKLQGYKTGTICL